MKFKRVRAPIETFLLQKIIKELQPQSYKERFLIRSGQQLQYILTKEIAYFQSAEGLVRLRHQNGKKYTVDYTLDQLVTMLDPQFFFRINRQLIIRIDCIDKIHSYFNSRLKLDLRPAPTNEVIVSRDRVPEFKAWLDH